MIYFDHNATTPLRPEVRAAMEPFLGDIFGNPSSPHAAGRQARAAVEMARQQVASLLGASPQELHFTSGGTEADNWALCGHDQIVTSAVEHPAVLFSAQARRDLGGDVTFIPVDEEGRIDPAAVVDIVGSSDAGVVSLILANNETGTIQPLAQIGSRLRQRSVLFHIDAVQAFGKIPVDVDRLGADLMSLSAHKINGPKGVGALYVRPGTVLAPWTHGGGHDGNLRAGTENVAGIVGFGAAAALRQTDMEEDAGRLSGLRDRLERGVLESIEDVVINGSRSHRLPGTLNISFRRVEAESILLGLDLEGIAVSSGSACTSGTAEPSHVLLAMGREPRLAAGAIRFSLGYQNTAAEVDGVVELLTPIIQRLRALSVY
ncbi:MAG TPA: cysteine desulfurase NifS [Candidatus Latescibacteria bacterium]|jgi:cysteine desulfurase|nr:cysteine desulfurase NifS [Candidatus Latescibacterota bacterium]|tara:strand:+ start:406 stop:1530 length:1125 start_codon:yes stop_codon:yes gene_type:complete